MPSAQTLKRIHQITWWLIFGGLFAITFGLILREAAIGGAWSLLCGGGIVCVVGVALVFWRSRLREAP
jgi:hypothetical protein